ncbi:magnesium transporter [Natroniella acetigena]|uniref:magnesium transporter n=1 Tax=Natroniella acetigena TaxID=52004 RepID=UPI00200A1077|nr:magnesium transporter [Natroniella acetigena]MCK8826442.1 magnesium transporter [Natroniella acetigena]
MPLYEEITQLISRKEMKDLKERLKELTVIEVVELIRELERKQQVIVFRLLGKDFAIEVFEKLEPGFQEELIASFAENEVIKLMEDLEYDDRARLLDELPAKVAKRIMNSFDKEERETIANLLGYAPETAGRIMNPDYICLKKGITAQEALDQVRKVGIDKEAVYSIYITSQERRLEGILSLRVLVMAAPDEKIENIMYDHPISVNTYTDQEDVARLLQQQDFLSVPVVDRENRLVGVVTFDDAMDVIEEETTEDILNKAGLTNIGQQETDRSRTLISGSLLDVFKVRLPFLIITLIGGMMAGAVIEGFEETLEAIAALAIFIPVIMDMGGNVGTQSSTIFSRALALGQINTRRFFKHWLREVGIGLSMGAFLGLAAGLIAAFWQQLPALGIVVGLSLILTVTIATSLGFMIPYILFKLGFDQAAGSDPIITTIKDITGLFIYFFLVSQFLGHML